MLPSSRLSDLQPRWCIDTNGKIKQAVLESLSVKAFQVLVNVWICEQIWQGVITNVCVILLFALRLLLSFVCPQASTQLWQCLMSNRPHSFVMRQIYNLYFDSARFITVRSLVGRFYLFILLPSLRPHMCSWSFRMAFWVLKSHWLESFNVAFFALPCLNSKFILLEWTLAKSEFRWLIFFGTTILIS